MASFKAAGIAFVAISVILLAIIAQDPYYFLNHLGGRTQHADKSRWANFGPVNNDKCWTNSVGRACEDVKIHGLSSTAFLACGSPEDRLRFYPGAKRVDPDPNRKYEEYFVKYEMESNRTTRLRVEGRDKNEDLVLHGLDIWQPADDETQISIFAVNHDRSEESVLLFSHILGTDSLRFVQKFAHPLIKTPNEVAAAGPRSFFVSNDHYYYGGRLRDLEDTYGPFRWASDVVYCEFMHDKLDCRVVTPKSSHAWANGVLLVDQGRTLMVNDIVDGTTTAYDVHPVTKKLKHRQTIVLGCSPDNLSEDPGSGDLIVSVVPSLANLHTRSFGDGPINYQNLIESAVLRLVKAKNYEPEILFWDDGSLLSILTGSAVDPVHGRLIASGVFERHFVICEI